MFADIETEFFGHINLTLFDLCIIKFLDPRALQAYQMVVVSTLIQLEHCLAAFKVMPGKQAGLFELGEDAVYRGQANIESLIDQYLVYILGTQMAYIAMLKQVEYLQPGQGSLETGSF